MTLRKRLEVLISTHEAKLARHEALDANDLAEQCRALCALLPNAERAMIESRGATGYATLMESYWMTARAGEAFTRQAALIAYRDALPSLRV